MKRCPDCRRDYYDDSLMYCLDDGSSLLEGPAAQNDPATAIWPASGEVFPARESATAVLPSDLIAPGQIVSSIAVLPFRNLSADVENEYFCDGLAEELLNALAKIDDLKVAARTSSFAFKQKDVTVGEIARTLGVAAIMEGSVRKSGDQLRITVQLVNAVDGFELWSERFDREMRDIFEIQDDITLAVVDALKVTLMADVRSKLLRKGTRDAGAHEYYLRGRALWNRRTYQELKKGIEYFERAIKLDPEYAEAYAGLADSYFTLAYFEAHSPVEIEPEARSAVERAVALGPSLPESHTSLAAYKTFFEFDVIGGESELRTAISIRPNSALGHYWLCSTLAAMGRNEEALAEGRVALKLDPLSAVASISLGRALCCLGKFEEAIDEATRSLELEPDFFLSHWILGWAREQLGDPDAAITHFRKAVAGGGLRMSGYLGKALVRAGQKDEARELLVRLQEESQVRFVSPISSAVILAELGEMPEALDLLEKAWKVRAFPFVWARSDPLFDAFRSESRFDQLCERIIVN